jgi:hypothetical protein
MINKNFNYMLQPEDCAAKSVHLDCLHNETSLLPVREGDDGQPIKRPNAESYNFVTECFFMTQKCIDLGKNCINTIFYVNQMKDPTTGTQAFLMDKKFVLLTHNYKKTPTREPSAYFTYISLNITQIKSLIKFDVK